MPVAEVSKEAALREQVAELKLKVNDYSGKADKLAKDLGAAHKALEGKAELEAENATLKAALAAGQARVAHLEESIKKAEALKDKAEADAAAGKQIAEALKQLG